MASEQPGVSQMHRGEELVGLATTAHPPPTTPSLLLRAGPSGATTDFTNVAVQEMMKLYYCEHHGSAAAPPPPPSVWQLPPPDTALAPITSSLSLLLAARLFPTQDMYKWLAYGNGALPGAPPLYAVHMKQSRMLQRGAVPRVWRTYPVCLPCSCSCPLLLPPRLLPGPPRSAPPPADGKHPKQGDAAFFQRREFCFTLDGDIFVRYQSFKVSVLGFEEGGGLGARGERGKGGAHPVCGIRASQPAWQRPARGRQGTSCCRAAPRCAGRGRAGGRAQGPLPLQDRHRPRVHRRPAAPCGLPGRGRRWGRRRRLCPGGARARV